jgi:ribosomal protein S18 acetylase RimI-like enzyme
MTIVPFAAADISSFLAYAARENWVVGAWEFEFLINRFPQGCFTARDDSGAITGFVTSLRHEQSGWIGNLIVAEQQRGSGIGTALFNKALAALTTAGAKTIWLTASTSGAPLYEKHGFRALDTIFRWIGTGRQRQIAHVSTTQQEKLATASYLLDAEAWGDRRHALLDVTAKRGTLLQKGSGFIVRQPSGDDTQLGPFLAEDAAGAEYLFDEAARAILPATKIMLDAPASNRAAQRLYKRRMMKVAACSMLMYAGKKPEYRADLIYGLATMGSCG